MSCSAVVGHVGPPVIAFRAHVVQGVLFRSGCLAKGAQYTQSGASPWLGSWLLVLR